MTAGGQALREPPRWAAGLAWALWGLAMAGLAVVWRLDRLLRQVGRVDLAPLGTGVATTPPR